MDDTDRLSRYLDGGLEPDEQQALEAELAGDAVLRAQLERLRSIDEQLATIATTELPPGARERLDARLTPVVRAAVADGPALLATAAPTTEEALGRRDELAARRSRRRLPVALGGVAAGLAVLVVGVLSVERLLPPSGGDDSTASVALDAMDDAGDAEEMAESAPEAAADARSPLPELPIVLADDRRVSAEDLDLALAAAPLQQVTAAALTDETAADLAAAAQTRLLGAAATDEDAPSADGAAPELGAPALTTADGRLLPPADVEAVQRCVAELLGVGTAAIPVLVELLEVDGVPALQVGLATLDPETDAYTRAEVWTLERATCQVLRFAQT